MLELKHTLLLSGCFLVLFAAAEALYRYAQVKVEYTRKLVHIGTGVLSMLFPVMLHWHWTVLFLCASFAGILVLSQRLSLLPSIHAIRRKSYGSLAYPAAVYLSFLAMTIVRERGISTLHPALFFYIPVLVMAFCDPAAALIGRKWPIKSFKVGAGRKSLAGCTAFFCVAFFLTFSLMEAFLLSSMKLGSGMSMGFMLNTALGLALVSMIAEAMTPQGFDNLTIPLSCLAYLLLVNFVLYQ